MTFKTTIKQKHPSNQARVTEVTTAHGSFTTPMFMPVATRAYVNAMTVEDLVQSGSEIILGGNTYHMLCAPGMDVIQSAGGMHRFMQWDAPMLTDSGGFQIFSLSKNSKICKIDEEGARFKHPDSGAMIRMTPESSIETQRVIGADIIMAFDQCTPNEDDRLGVVAAMERTHRWLTQCKEYHLKNPQSHYGYDQALFGIIQGGMFRDLREQSAEFIVSQELDGIAFGGETIGFDMEKTGEVLDWLLPIIPENKTRYTMGVGLHPQNLIDAVAHGADIFDCVAPTRNARHGALYCGEIVKEGDWIRYAPSEDGERLLIKKKIFDKDEKPIAKGCDCHTCQHYTRAYLHYLFKNKSWLYHQLACIHNVRVMQAVCEAMRESILSANLTLPPVGITP